MSTTRPSGTSGGLDDPYSGVESTRRGAHRARPTPLMAALPAAAVVVVVVLVAFGVYTLLGGAGGGGNSGSGDTAAGAEASPSVSGQSSPSPSADAEQSPDDEPTEEPEPDRTIKVTVLNNTSRQGLAAKGKNKLAADGWTIKAIGDHKPRGSVPTTTVFYATEEQKVTAEAISQAIGVGGVEESSEIAGDGITVVLSTDFTP